MPKKARELSALEVGRLKTPGLYFVGGVKGLALQVAPGGARTWILRFSIAGKRRDMGLGGFPEITLAAAREKAREARTKIERGIDPILDRHEAKSALVAAAAAAKTFAQCVTDYLDAKSAEWKNPKHRQQWSNTLEQYANPVIGQMLVRDVGLAHVLKILEPIWTTKTETAYRLQGRIASVLDWAAVRGYRSGDNPARWRGNLDKLLPKPSKVAKVKHHRALDIDAVPGFMAALRQQEGLGARALEFLILTATRSGEVRGATWDEIDLDNAIWTIPANRMKAGKDHRVPLSPQAVELLNKLPRVQGTTLLFPSSKNTPLSDMTLTGVLRRMGVAAVPHGFRSTFRDWSAERTNFPRDVAEMALAHTIPDKVEAAYRRGDLFAKRVQLMNAWAKFSDSPASVGGRVVPIEKAKRGGLTAAGR